MDPRIEHYRKMAEADPTNELAHFTLGRAYLDAGHADEAIGPFQRVIELKPDMSPAYERLAVALLAANQKEQAIAQLTKGIEVAHARGDIMPRNTMLRMLKDLGAPVPQLAQAQQQQVAGEGEIACHRCGKVGPKLKGPPFRNAQGQKIFDNICAPCWREWVAMGTKVINELRLELADPQAQKIYDSHMMEFLNLQ